MLEWIIWTSSVLSFIIGIYIAIVPILMEQEDHETVMVKNANLTAIALKFLTAMQPNKSCLHHKALKL